LLSQKPKELCKEAIATLNRVWQMSSNKAAEDLTAMAGEEFTLSDVSFKQLPLEDIPDFIGPPDMLVSTVMIEVAGRCKGEILLILPKKSADELISMLFQGMELSEEEIQENRISALRETGNILCSAFLNSVAAITDFEVLPTVPSDAEDMLAAIIDIIQIKYASIGDFIFVAESSMKRGSNPLDLYLIAIFEPESLVEIVNHSNEDLLE
jgi:chemotaxis protein CheC